MMTAAVRRKRRNAAARSRGSVCTPFRSWRRSANPTNNTYAIRLRMAYPKTSACTAVTGFRVRSEEHTSELQSHSDLVCRLLLEKKKKKKKKKQTTKEKKQESQ